MIEKQESQDHKAGLAPLSFLSPYSNFYNIALFECATNAFRALMDEVGANKALEAIKPYNVYTGKVIADMAKKRLGFQGSDAEAVAMTYYWYHCATSNGRIKPMEIRDGKAIVEVHACPSTIVGSPPEICVAISHYVAEGVSEAINPDYEFVWTHHLANGDDCCRYVVKKKSEKFSLDHPGKLEKTVPLELPQAEMDMLTGAMAVGELWAFTRASMDVIGFERTMELVLPLQRRTGYKLGIKLKREANEKSDLLTLRDGLALLSPPFNQPASSAIITNIGMEKEISDCPYKPFFPAMPNGIPPPEVCTQLDEVSKGICEAMNPDYEFVFDRMISKGDSSCHWVVRTKGEPSKEKLNEATISDDPARMFAMRFAKGEISQEEFDKSMELLKKHKVVK